MAHAKGSTIGPLRVVKTGGAYLLWPYDADEPPPAWFDPAALAASGRARPGGTGRGATVSFDADGRTLVLRHFRRGGAVRDLLGDRYLRCGLRRSRPARELALLVYMHRAGLPVPPPVGARVRPASTASPFYRGDLITEHLPATRTLAERLCAGGAVPPSLWHRLGARLARFHAAGVDHADLNAHNVLVGADGEIYLIDFDRGHLHKRPGRWRGANLRRLRRSLDKLAGTEAELAFSEPDWEALIRGYREAGGRHVAATSSASRRR